MSIPNGFRQVKRGIIRKGDYIAVIEGVYEDWANGVIGEKIQNGDFKVWRPQKSKEVSKTSTNTTKAKIAILVREARLHQVADNWDDTGILHDLLTQLSAIC